MIVGEMINRALKLQNGAKGEAVWRVGTWLSLWYIPL